METRVGRGGRSVYILAATSQCTIQQYLQSFYYSSELAMYRVVTLRASRPPPQKLHQHFTARKTTPTRRERRDQNEWKGEEVKGPQEGGIVDCVELFTLSRRNYNMHTEREI